VVTIVVCSFFFLHFSTLWFVIPQFVQCLLLFFVLFCVFVGAVCLGIYGIEKAHLVSAVIMSFSHNISTSLCCCNVDHFIPIVARSYR
jgi:uncharacterized membrane protein